MTKEEIEAFLTGAKFTFAKTMAKIPHSWIVRKDYDDATFLEVMNFIKNNGYVEKFFGRPYIYYNVGPHKYWVATDRSGFSDPTAIINRAKL